MEFQKEPVKLPDLHHPSHSSNNISPLNLASDLSSMEIQSSLCGENICTNLTENGNDKERETPTSVKKIFTSLPVIDNSNYPKLFNDSASSIDMDSDVGSIDSCTTDSDSDAASTSSSKKKKGKKSQRGSHACAVEGCGKVFSRPYRLEQHSRIHTGAVSIVYYYFLSFSRIFHFDVRYSLIGSVLYIFIAV